MVERERKKKKVDFRQKIKFCFCLLLLCKIKKQRRTSVTEVDEVTLFILYFEDDEAVFIVSGDRC
jgi:hypothetical protein